MKFVERAEREVNESAPSAAGKDKSPESPSIMLAAAYLTRGKLYAKSGESDKAMADYEKSYAAYPSQQLAERLGDLAAKKNDLERALNEYATAFAFPGPGTDPSHREEVRRKLGSCYVALHQSEKGLGDLVLARYDELVRALAPRFQDSRQPNANLRDPFAYVLERTDGSPLRLADYRGKVLVLEFWATWCGPCRMEGKLLERVAENFRNEPAAVFLAVNVDEDRAGVPAFLKEEQWTTPGGLLPGTRPAPGRAKPPHAGDLRSQRARGLSPGRFGLREVRRYTGQESARSPEWTAPGRIPVGSKQSAESSPQWREGRRQFRFTIQNCSGPNARRLNRETPI